MCPFIRLVTPILAVNFPEKSNVLWTPPAEENEVVEPRRMLVKTHEREERVEDLVVDFKPGVFLRLCEESVQHSSHDHKENSS